MNKEVYSQSVCLINIVADMYYFKKHSQSKIAEELNISKATVSRLLKLAVENGTIQFVMKDMNRECLGLQVKLKAKYPNIKELFVVPVSAGDSDALSVKKQVAREGSRYLQRVLSENQILGMTWGGTMHYMIQYLNPCRKKNTGIITMHGDISECGREFDVNNLVRRAAMAFGGNRFVMGVPGYLDNPKQVEKMQKNQKYQNFIKMFRKINIAVTGVGDWYPGINSPLGADGIDYLKKEDFDELKKKHVAADFLLHFLDRDGNEISSEIKKRTLSIDLDIYKMIPIKVVMASGANKAYSVHAVLNGGYTNVLIIDYYLAKYLFELHI